LVNATRDPADAKRLVLANAVGLSIGSLDSSFKARRQRLAQLKQVGLFLNHIAISLAQEYANVIL
jgi:hypothetical protein